MMHDVRLDRRARLIGGTAVAALVAMCLGGPSAARQAKAPTARTKALDPLAEGFRTPPQPAQPQVWWHWMSGNVTAEGARLDLEWMQRIGIGGVHAFAGGVLEQPMVPQPLPFMSNGWRTVYHDAVNQARAAGMDVTIAGSPGWSETGGPWVTPAQGMKKYTWSVTEVEGGHPVQVALAPPPATTGPFLDVPREKSPFGPDMPSPQASGPGPVIAFPTPPDERPLHAAYSSRSGPLAALGDAPDALLRSVALPVSPDGKTYVDITLDAAATVTALTIAADPLPGLEVLASDDGRTFRTVRRIEQDDAEKPAAQRTIALPPTRASVFRLRFDAPRPWRVLPDLPSFIPPARPADTLKLHLLRLETAPRIDRFEAKAGFQSTVTPDERAPAGDAGITLHSVIDLTDRLRADGTLDWTPPKGRWTILRFGWSLTGQTNGPAEPGATGLEVDKLDAGAVRNYVGGLFALYRDKGGNRLGKGGINGLLTDSWEAGAQNWTPGLLADFRRLRGYDPTPWLPTLAGWTVRDTKASNAFLFDFRRTLKELLVQNHYGVLAEAAHRQGMTYYTEAQGDTPRAIGDGLAIKAMADVPTGEYWYRPFASDPGQPSLIADLKEAASAAHLHGKPLVAAEAMTVATGSDPWAFSPAMLKPVADTIFAQGVNRMLIHESHLQPFADRKPGLMLGFFGQFFNRNDTWAERAKPWVDYLARTSWMLQQGHYVADVAYFYGEDENLTQRFEHRAEDAVPAGYGYDYVDADTLLHRLWVRDGRIVAAGGMTYRILYVPADITHMTLPVVEKLAALVRAGAVVVAGKPQGGLGLASGDAQVRAAADALWDGDRHDVGKGRLYATETLAQAMRAEHVVPDVAAPASTDVQTLHRRTADADIYFVSSRADRDVRLPLAFRTKGRAADWWSAEDGAITPLSYRPDGETTRVDLPLAAKQAGFVVFRRPATRGFEAVEPREIAAQALDGPWDVRFQAGRGAPATALFPQLADWSKSADPGIRYFSGPATYRHAVTVDKAGLGPNRRFVLDLGNVHEVATVSVNGKEVRTLWHAPYRVDLTGVLRPGINNLAVEVINLWPNRLIGDKQPGATAIAYAPQSPYQATSPLLPSGLLGPVRLIAEEIVEAAPHR